jgi:transcriptional regulator with PAS, ATPase and Fis domain
VQTTPPEPHTPAPKVFQTLVASAAWQQLRQDLGQAAQLSLQLQAAPQHPSPSQPGAVRVHGVTVAFVVAEGATDASDQRDTWLDIAARWLGHAAEQLSQAQHAQRLLREQQAIVDHISDGLLVLEPGGVIRHINAAAARMLRLPAAQALGQALCDVLDFDTQVAAVFASGSGYVDRELIINSKRIQLHIIDTAVPIRSPDGEVLSVVNTFREITAVRRLADRIAGNHARYTLDSVIGESPAIQRAIAAARQAARGHASVLISGESGTGKEVFAQAIHNASPRAKRAFIAINCAALPRELIESELFGYTSGSFTGAAKGGRPGKFESADGGTIFLDELSELPLDVQAKLLRVLQEREVVRIGDTRAVPIDVRIISASNRDLAHMVQLKEFRQDLYYRCQVIALPLPPLRERPQDIAPLAQHFLQRCARSLGKPTPSLSPQALASLTRHPWPGNVRELENVIERWVHLSDDAVLTQEMLPAEATPEPVAPATQAPAQLQTLSEMERQAIVHTLREVQHNVTRAAQILGIAKPTLYAKIKRHGIPLERLLPLKN